MTRYEWLLLLHLLGAFATVGAVVAFTVVRLVTPSGDGVAGLPTRPLLFLAQRLIEIGGLLVLVFGVWLAIDLDQYGIFDGWVLAALALWFVSMGSGTRLGQEYAELSARRRNSMYVVMTTAVTAMLVVMIYKPGA